MYTFPFVSSLIIAMVGVTVISLIINKGIGRKHRNDNDAPSEEHTNKA